MTQLNLILSDLEKSKLFKFQSLISRNGGKLGPILLTINRRPYMASPKTSWHLTLNLSLRFQSLISRKGHKLLLIINRKPYMGNPMTPPHLMVKITFTQYRVLGDMYGIHRFANSLLLP